MRLDTGTLHDVHCTRDNSKITSFYFLFLSLKVAKIKYAGAADVVAVVLLPSQSVAKRGLGSENRNISRLVANEGKFFIYQRFTSTSNCFLYTYRKASTGCSCFDI